MTWPLASTVIVGTTNLLPYEPADTPELSCCIVIVSALADVDKSLPPTIVSVSLLLSATAVPELVATFLKIFCDEPLSVFVYVTT